jgi:hypothetical protein
LVPVGHSLEQERTHLLERHPAIVDVDVRDACLAGRLDRAVAILAKVASAEPPAYVSLQRLDAEADSVDAEGDELPRQLSAKWVAIPSVVNSRSSAV